MPSPYRAVEAFVALCHAALSCSAGTQRHIVHTVARVLTQHAVRTSMSGTACSAYILTLARKATGSDIPCPLFRDWLFVLATLVEKLSAWYHHTESLMFHAVLSRSLFRVISRSEPARIALGCALQRQKVPFIHNSMLDDRELLFLNCICLCVLQLLLDWGHLSSSMGADPVGLATSCHWLWIGHQRYGAGHSSLAIDAFTKAGVLGTPALVAALLSEYDVAAAVALALRVCEICFADGFSNLKRFVTVAEQNFHVLSCGFGEVSM